MSAMLSVPLLKRVPELPLASATLEQLKTFLSQAQTINRQGEILIATSEHATTLDKLCGRVVDLKKQQSRWDPVDKVHYQQIAEQVREIHDDSFRESVVGGPCCFSWIARDEILWPCCNACCSCPSAAVVTVMTDRGN